MTDEPESPRNVNEVHEAVGAVIVAATELELRLADAVASLTRSPLATLIVQGERGTGLIRMCRNLLKDGIGSTQEDQRSGRTERLKLLSFEETEKFLVLLQTAERLLGDRDFVAHATWLDFGEGLEGHKVSRTARRREDWPVAKLRRIAQDLRNATADVSIAAWNVDSDLWSGMPRQSERQGDVR